MRALSRSRQDYLKALSALDQGEGVPTSRLAAQLGVSAPSVTNMLARLVEERLVHHAPRAGARLTARGRREALAMVRRHRILETFLVRVLGFSGAVAVGAAFGYAAHRSAFCLISGFRSALEGGK